jgi:hypothetical protein
METWSGGLFLTSLLLAARLFDQQLLNGMALS